MPGRSVNVNTVCASFTCQRAARPGRASWVRGSRSTSGAKSISATAASVGSSAWAGSRVVRPTVAIRSVPPRRGSSPEPPEPPHAASPTVSATTTSATYSAHQIAACSSAKWHATGCPCPRSMSSGSLSAHTSWAFQHRVRKRQPLGGSAGDSARRLPARSGGAAAPCGGPAPAPRSGAPGCRGAQGARTRRRRAPISTSLPRYITPTESQMWRTTPRSWAMNTYASPSSAWRSSSRFTTPAWIDTSSAETGSSSTSSSGLSDRAARDADALALATRELVRVAGRVLGVETDELHELLDPLRAARSVDAVDAHRLRDDRLPPSCAGRATRTGPGTRSACVAASRAGRAFDAVSTSAPRKRTDPEVAGMSRSTTRPVVDLPQPDSPTMPNVSDAAHREAHARTPPGPDRRCGAARRRGSGSASRDRRPRGSTSSSDSGPAGTPVSGAAVTTAPPPAAPRRSPPRSGRRRGGRAGPRAARARPACRGRRAGRRGSAGGTSSRPGGTRATAADR